MSRLFTSGKIGGLTLKNRIIMTAVHTGFSPEREAAFLAERARGGAAAVTAVMGVCPGGAFANMSVLSQDFLGELAEMSRRIRKEGSEFIVQLFHAGRNCRNGALADPDLSIVAPSAVPSPIYKDVPKALEADEIAEIIRCFGAGAKLCKDAGVSAVEISASAGYLLSQFLSPLTNLREDGYGGSAQNRFRFPLEVCRAVRAAVGPEYPVVIRVSAGDMLGGYQVEDTCAFLQEAQEFVDAVNVTGGWHESSVPQISMYLPEGGFAYLARVIRESLNIPVIACNRINNLQTAEKVLAEDCADFAGAARAFLIDSGFVNKLQSGQRHKRCIACNKGCIEPVLKMGEAGCVFNPRVGKEGEAPFPSLAGRAFVAGGGPGGMTAAALLAKQGMEVTLFEKEDTMGGALRAAAKIPHKEPIAENLQVMEEELQRNGVRVMMNTSLSRERIEKESPDLVVIAAGGIAWIPPIKGIEAGNVVTAEEVLLEKKRLQGKRIVILGGGAVGLETALAIAEKTPEVQVTVLEAQSKAGVDLGGLRRSVLLDLQSRNISLLTGTMALEIDASGVICDQLGQRLRVEADEVVVATGVVPNHELKDALTECEAVPFEVIGDAKQTGNLGQAIRQAYGLLRKNSE